MIFDAVVVCGFASAGIGNVRRMINIRSRKRECWKDYQSTIIMVCDLLFIKAAILR